MPTLDLRKSSTPRSPSFLLLSDRKTLLSPANRPSSNQSRFSANRNQSLARLQSTNNLKPESGKNTDRLEMYQRGPGRGAGGSKASPVGGFSLKSGLRNYHNLRVQQQRQSLQLSIKLKPSVTQHVPFFS